MMAYPTTVAPFELSARTGAQRRPIRSSAKSVAAGRRRGTTLAGQGSIGRQASLPRGDFGVIQLLEHIHTRTNNVYSSGGDPCDL
jgi:hypothetical protein